MRTWVALAGVLLWGCEEPVTETTVTGSVRGVGLGAVEAVTRRDANFFDGARQTVWLGAPPVCARLREAPLGDAQAFRPSHLRLADGGQAPLLIVQSTGAAWFDTGRGHERVEGSAKFENSRVDDSGTASARFVATFPRDGGTPDQVVGSFVATPCPTADAGCSSAPACLAAGAALMLLRRRRAPAY